ncbi:hypothetical protein NIES21_61140 (plasmid) [Anabaenopsis circularis NIES-21]|uniref:GIY-YIG domain-containing protein n=1 Tax=Anabaenopsis circularis NIES-21 TaxID=1085406 RepID=A0A1Z4GRW2_9CYAN|nr:hypothetical protein NIES21_61140 [Anabaenopsis circularis NIES-21]
MSESPRKDNFNIDKLEKFVDILLDNPHLFYDLFNPGYAPPLSIRDFACLPDMPGIYIVAATNSQALDEICQIVYIGVATKSIKKRWAKHHKLEFFYFLERMVKGFKQFKDIEDGKFYLGIFCWVNPFASAKFLLSFENLLINRINPPANYLKVGKNRDAEIEEDFLKFLKYLETEN